MKPHFAGALLPPGYPALVVAYATLVALLVYSGRELAAFSPHLIGRCRRDGADSHHRSIRLSQRTGTLAVAGFLALIGGAYERFRPSYLSSWSG